MTDVPSIDTLIISIGFIIFACLVAFAWAPLLTNFLYKFRITVGRRAAYDSTAHMTSRDGKANTPTMGGILVIVTIALITYLFNWDQSFTWLPIGIMLLSSALGALDDLLNIFGSRRRSRKVNQTLRLIRVHKNYGMRLWLIITLPWTFFKRLTAWLGSHPGKGVHVHEKLFLQFIAGGISAWWIFYKLGENWRVIDLPFDGMLDIGWWLVPLIVLVVAFTANAVNIADGMDGLAGGMLIPTFTALMFLSWVNGFPEMAILNAVAVGALITYTYFNIMPARFQMGDVGSLGLGALLAINALIINAMIVLPLLAFVFYIEAFSVLIQVASKKLTGRRVFKMAPIHHHLEIIGWNEEKIVMRLWIIHLFFVLVGVWVALH
ncbi:hypothetical protein COB55_00310 [Candidatus Wolfebacteria bacterium]|nr:MAG: hypothetical protein COB55_00310 [Candidatus Wolfebacteria bacterium]